MKRIKQKTNENGFLRVQLPHEVANLELDVLVEYQAFKQNF